MNPLPPSDVRRQGDRLRRRNTAVAGIGGALAVALIATPIALLGARGDGDATPDPAPPVDWVQSIPADFPVDDGMGGDSSIPTTVGDERPYGDIVLPPVHVCGSDAWSPEDALDVLGAVWSDGVEGGEQRTLAVYADGSTAERSLAALEDAIAACTPSGPSDFEYAALDSATGEDSYAWVQRWRSGGEPTGETEVWHAIRVGNAVLLNKTFVPDAAPAVSQEAADLLGERAEGPVDAMCVFSAAGCATPPPPPAEPAGPVIPDDFPLLSGWPSDDSAEPGADMGRQGPSRSLEEFSYTACGVEALAPAAGDYLRASWSNVEDYRTRELFTFSDADAAAAEVDRFVAHFMSCPQESSSPESVLYTEQRPVTLGGQSEAIVRIQGTADGPAIGMQVLLVVRLGNSIVIDTAYNEGVGTERNIRAQINGQGSDLAEVISAMCLFTEAGCG